MGQEEFSAAVRRVLDEQGRTLQWLADQLGEAYGRRIAHSTVVTWLDRSIDPQIAFMVE